METTPTRQPWLTPQIYDLNAAQTQSGDPMIIEFNAHTEPSTTFNDAPSS